MYTKRYFNVDKTLNRAINDLVFSKPVLTEKAMQYHLVRFKGADGNWFAILTHGTRKEVTDLMVKLMRLEVKCFCDWSESADTEDAVKNATFNGVQTAVGNVSTGSRNKP